MPLLTEARVRAAGRQAASNLKKSAVAVLAEAIRGQLATSFDIFLSHSIEDAEIVRGMKTILENDFHFTVYVDWIIDPQLKRAEVTRETAALLRRRMQQCAALLYLQTDNSQLSTWMPWELGYFDALKGRVGILPVTRNLRQDFRGNEYLGLYPYVDVAPPSGGVREKLWINRTRNEYAELAEWIADQYAIQKHS